MPGSPEGSANNPVSLDPFQTIVGVGWSSPKPGLWVTATSLATTVDSGTNPPPTEVIYTTTVPGSVDVIVNYVGTDTEGIQVIKNYVFWQIIVPNDLATICSVAANGPTLDTAQRIGGYLGISYLGDTTGVHAVGDGIGGFQLLDKNDNPIGGGPGAYGICNGNVHGSTYLSSSPPASGVGNDFTVAVQNLSTSPYDPTAWEAIP